MRKGWALLRAAMVAGLLTVGVLAGAASAAEVRGTVAKVEEGSQIRIDLPAGAAARPGDEVRVETVIPGIGPVEIKSRWRVKLVGEGFVIADPEGQASGTPQVGHTAIVTSAEATPGVPAAPAQAGADAAASLRLNGEQLAALRKRADGGETEAMIALGAYHAGEAHPSDSTPRNLDEAIGWYEKAAAKGSASAMTSLGFLYQARRQDAAKAAEWLRKAAENGDAAAMATMGRLHTQGRGVAKDDRQAFEWAKKAAEKGDDFAAHELGTMYFKGLGTRQDFVEAAHWFRRAADGGVAPAMTMLAMLHGAGMGLAKDEKRSFEWSQKAAEAGSLMSMYQLGTCYLTGAGVAANPAEAKRWYEKAANAGGAEGMYGLGYLYEKGIGVAANPGLAADWMVLAIRAGSLQAAESLIRTPGDWSAAFRQALQKRLREAGVYQGKIDGDIGSGTRRAIAALNGRDLVQ